MNAPCVVRTTPAGRPAENLGKPSHIDLSDSIAQSLLAFMLCAVGAAIIFSVSLHTMTNNFAAAMRAARSAGVNSTFETIEIPGLALHLYLKGFVIFISANVTASHSSFPLFERDECRATGKSLLPERAQPESNGPEVPQFRLQNLSDGYPSRVESTQLFSSKPYWPVFKS